MFNIKWVLVEWQNPDGMMPQYSVVRLRTILEPKSDLHTGKLVRIADDNGSVRRAKVVMSSDDRRFLKQQVVAMEEHSRLNIETNSRRNTFEDNMAPSPIPLQNIDRQSVEYSSSASSWSPGENSNSDSESEDYKMMRGSESRRVRHSKSYRLNKSSYKDRSTSAARPMESRNSQSHKHNRRRVFTPRHKSSSTPYNRNRDSIAMRYDQGTQTSRRLYQLGKLDMPKIEEKIILLERIIEELEDKFSSLETTIGSWSTGIDAGSQTVSTELHDLPMRQYDFEDTPNVSAKIDTKQSKITRGVKTRDSTSWDERSESDDINSSDMVPIGSGKTLVPRHIVQQIDWNSYTIATRKLLMAVFPRRTLATHSLTGKSSPAFRNKPAKLCLDPAKVDDIVTTVTTNCNVKDSLVRSAITTKCADENKMFRMRQQKIEKRANKSVTENKTNQENIPPCQANGE